MSNHSGGRVLLALLLLAMWPADSLAQAITRQVTLVVPYSAGGGTDVVARLIGNPCRAASASPSLSRTWSAPAARSPISALPAPSPMAQPC